MTEYAPDIQTDGKGTTIIHTPNMYDDLPMKNRTGVRAIYTLHEGERLDYHDRCDSCGSQAYGRATFVTNVDGHEAMTDLLFCGHHLRQNLDRLMATAMAVDDYTPILKEDAAINTMVLGG